VTYEAAYDHLTALTDHAPDFAEGWNARATLLFQMGAYGPSIADIQRVLALEPRHFGR
jgi:tetratricopeptide (TPR) repeat protein